VTGDEEEDGVDDIDNEFNWNGHDSQSVAESMLYGHMSYGRGGDPNGVPQPFQLNPNVPLLTNGQMVLVLQNPSITVPLPPPYVGLLVWQWLNCLFLVRLQVDDIPPEQHALVPSFMGGGGKRIHPLPYADPSLPGVYLDDHQPKLSCGHGALNLID